MSVELKVGQVWRDRKGRKVTVEKESHNENYPFSGSNGETYTAEGTVYAASESPDDLIELVQNERGWRPWKATADSQCPVDGGTKVLVRLACGTTSKEHYPQRADQLIWSELPASSVIAYKIVQEAPKAEEPPAPKPGADGWIPYAGGGCPVAAGTQLEVRFADGTTHSGIAGDYYWCSIGDGSVIAYRIVKEIQQADEPVHAEAHSTPQRTPRRHSHYFKDVSQINEIDVYRVCDLFGVDDPSGATQHAVKKLLCAGQRGAKDRAKDYQEAIDTLTRRVEMWVEGRQ